MATMVRQRRRELGVRIALGATSRDLRRLVLGRGLVLALSGTTIGLAGALAANRLLAAMLFEVGPTDPATLLAVGGLFVGVAVLATGIPARSTACIDPVLALRAE
jgi:putative ABC transport system permease protein